ncbi:MAG: hypothetical protein LBT89_06850 [Planctomycetaceae bacterium]|nr:hypothetical protein [Planctomycetaceae bacterium]
MSISREIQKQIDQLAGKLGTFKMSPVEFLSQIYVDITKIGRLNNWNEDEVVEALPENLKLLFVISDLQTRIEFDGLIAFFDNHMPEDIKQKRKILSKLGRSPVLDEFDKAYKMFSGNTGSEELTDTINGLGEKIVETIDTKSFAAALKKTIPGLAVEWQ